MDIIAEYRYDGMKHIEFKFKNKTCIALMNEDESKRNGKTVFKTEYFGAFPDLQNEFVRRGYTLIFIENRNRWGTPDQLNDQYEFINYETTSDYFLMFSKVMLKGTKFEEWWSSQVSFTQGINIDIFVLVNTPNNKFKRYLHLKTSHIYDRLLTMSVIELNDYPNPTKFIANTIHKILKLTGISPEFFKKRAWKSFNKYKDDECIYASTPTSTYVKLYKKGDYFPPVKTKFEDTEVYIGNNPDSILSTMFGDYMQLPPEDKRENHAPENLDFGPYGVVEQ